MTPKSEQLVDLIFKKLKTYKNKKIFLEKENFDKFISSLLEEWIQDLLYSTAIVKLIFLLIKYMDNFSSLTFILIIIFTISIYFLFRVTSSTKN